MTTKVTEPVIEQIVNPLLLPVAFGRVDMSGNLVGDNFGVSSTSDDGTGLATITLSDAMADANYTVVATPQLTGAVSRSAAVISQTTTSFTLQAYTTHTAGATESAVTSVNFVVYGTKA
jgi:hypothetical protein